MSGNIPFTEYAVVILWDIQLQYLINAAGLMILLALLILGYYTWHLNLQQELEYQAWLQRKGLADSHREFHAEFLAEKP